MPYLIRTDPKDPRGDLVQIIIFGEPTPIHDYCICDGCNNSAGCNLVAIGLQLEAVKTAVHVLRKLQRKQDVKR